MKKVAIADDDPGIRDVFSLILNRAGYEVSSYSNGEMLMNKELNPPDLFIIDKQLSGVDGLDVCHYLKQQKSTKDIPVIITSASPHVAKLAEEAGADEFIEKPFNMKSLIKHIEKIFEKNLNN